MRVLLASGNAKKLDELRRILTPLMPEIDVLGLSDVPAYGEPAETEPTFEGNALIKARAALEATGLPAGWAELDAQTVAWGGSALVGSRFFEVTASLRG